MIYTRLYLLIIFIFATSLAFGQGGFEISQDKWLKFLTVSDSTRNLKAFPVIQPLTASGLVIYGTPSFVTNFVTEQYTNGTFVTTGSITPGLEYSLNLAKYSVQPTQTNITNYAGLGLFVVAGGTGTPLKSSCIGGATISISSYAQVGYGYDFINKKGEFVIGAAFPLNIIEQSILASILWVHPQ